MNKNLKQVQWLVFWLAGWLPLALMAAVIAPPAAAVATAAAPSLPAQDFPSTEPEFETLRDAESIDNQVITALAQDARGLIWIGTQQGLVRYDGYRFRKFVHKASDPFSLAGDYVTALAVAKDGRIWVGTTSDGISIFDPASEHFEHFKHDEKAPGSLSGGRIWALANDGRGGMWIGTDQGLDHLPPGSRRFAHFRHGTAPHSLMDDKVRSLLLDKAGRLWVGTSSGLQRLSLDGKSFETVVTGRDVQTLFQAQDGKLWLGTREHGAAWLDSSPGDGMPPNASPGGVPQQPHWLPLVQLSNPWVLGIVQVKTDQIWLASSGGGIIIVAASDGHVLQTLRHDPLVTGSLAYNFLSSLLLDRAGWLWVGTWGAGLQRMNANNTMLRILRHSAKRPNGLSHPDVMSVLELADGRLAFGTNGNGIDIFDRQRGLTGGYRTGQRQGEGQAGGLPDTTIHALAQTSDGSIWAGTQLAGVVRQLPGSTAWVAVPGLPGKQVLKLLAGRDGSLWAGTSRGVARWHPATPPPQPARKGDPAEQPTRFEVLTDERGKAMENPVHALAEDGQGRVWIGTNNGLWLHEPHRRGLIHIPADPKHPDGLVSNYINGLLIDSRNSLWVATDKGLERLKNLDGKLARFEHVSALLGQPGKAMGGNLLEDRQGRIWTSEWVIEQAGRATGDRAAHRTIKLRRTPLTQADGMDLGATWTGSYGQTRDGLLLFGGTQGVAIIDPARFKAYDYAPPLAVTELKINGEAVAPGVLANPLANQSLPAGAGNAASLTLAPAQRNFSIEFAALDYSEPKKNRYQYRLQGYEKDWINTDADHRSAAYGNLWPGLYTLQVRGSNRMGEWSTHELSIPIRVLPAWWQTWWFWALLVLLLASAIYGGHRWRMAGLHKKALALQKLVAARTADIVKLGEIGQELTSTLDMEQTFERIWKQVSARLDAYVFLIGLYDEAAAQIVIVYEIENQERSPNYIYSMSEHERPAVWCVRERRELAVATVSGMLDYFNTILPPSIGESTETVVYLPLLVEQRVIGCISVQSLKQHAYNPDQLEFLRVLASYTAIALSNSTAHADLASAHRNLQETQQQLLLQEKMAGLGTLTAGVAHEINNPTNFVHVSAQIQQTDIAEFEQFVASLIEADGPDSAEILQAFNQRFAKLAGNVNTMLNGTERIIAIVKDLRSFSRLDESARKTVRLSECLLSTVNLVRTSWLEQVEFIADFSDDPELECWPALLNQAFMNLLINGCQAIAEKHTTIVPASENQNRQRGKVWLRLQLDATSNTLMIVFQDNGAGIDPAIQGRIMEPFFTTRVVGSGTGLGLSTAFGIVQKHGGSLEFTSTPGEGSCFTIRLPTAANTA
jgi:signal transduction histidine kinase/ligand-binding sensor domain-containing protein